MSQQPDNIQTEQAAAKAVKNGKKKPEENLTMAQELYQTLQSLVWIVLAVIFLFTFVMRITMVDGASMENTLHDRNIVAVRSIAYTPKQGDIVVLTKESFREGQSIIKRVIATEGQTVDIDYSTSTVYVDGEALTEPYIKEYMRVPVFGDVVNHLTVPEGCIFVMGDNRTGSNDSRFLSQPYIPVDAIQGHMLAAISIGSQQSWQGVRWIG